MIDRVIRYGVFGKQSDGHTFWGHKFAHSQQEVEEWLKSEKAVESTVGFFSLPDELLLDYDVYKAVCEACNTKDHKEGNVDYGAIRVFIALNQMALDGKFDV